MRVLIVDEHEGAEALVTELGRAGLRPQWSRADSGAGLIEGLYPAPDVILCAEGTPGLEPLDVLATLRGRRLDVPVIVVGSRLDEENCVPALRAGAADYLLRDRLARLGPAVEQALTGRRLRQEKRAAERREERTASILRGVVANAPAAISVKSVDGSYLLANEHLERLRGIEPGALIGRIDAEVFPVEQARQMTELDARCLHHEVVVEQEEEIAGAGGPRSHLCVRYPVVDDGGEVFGIGAIHLDITRQKRVEARLRAERAEVLHRTRRIGAGIEQLRDLVGADGREHEDLRDLVQDLLLLARPD